MHVIGDVFEFLSALSLVHWIVLGIYSIVLLLVRELVFGRWILGRHRRLYKNLKRPVVVLRPLADNGGIVPGGEMIKEIDLLRENGFLNIAPPTDYRSFDPSGKHCVIVLGYKEGMEGLGEVLNRVKTHHAPLIVYTFGNNRVAEKDKKELDSYPYILYANFPLTLLNHIFATAASYPYEQK